MRIFNLEIKRKSRAKNSTSPLPALGASEEWTAYLTGKGVACSPTTALQVGAVFRCVDLLSKTMATLPIHLYKETPDGKEKAKTHRAYNLVLRMPNPYTTAYDFWQMFWANQLLTEGGYAKIQRDGNGFVKALWNIPTANVTKMKNSETGERYIVVTDGDGKSEALYPGEYLYVPNFRFSSDSSAENPLAIAGSVISTTKDMEQFAHAAFSQGVNPGGFLEIPGGLSEDAYNRLAEDFEAKYAGVQNAGKYILLEEGTKAVQFTRDLEKTQSLQSRKFAVSEVCRLFGVPPHLCFDLEHATFSNIEQQSLEFVRDAINPQSVHVEQALYRDLLSEKDRKDHYFKVNTNALVRGDMAARTAYYNTMRQNGIMCADEIRAMEDMNDIPGGLGKEFFVNGNMITLETAKNNLPNSMANTERKKNDE